MRTSYLVGLGFLLAISGVIGYEMVRGPTPIEDLLPEDAAFDPQVYDGSMASDPSAPSVLILGTSHLAQDDHDYAEAAVDRVTNRLSSYDPDLVVVEYLPPEYPRGKGRDYRPDWDLDTYAEAWGMTVAEADSLRRAHRRPEASSPPGCTLAKAYLLNYDLVNAHYYAQSQECTGLRQFDKIREWMNRNDRHEMARLGYPVARRSDIAELVSFDYQGDDAEWFIYQSGLDALKSGRVWVLWNYWPILPNVGTTSRAYERHAAPHDDRLVDMLRYANSPEHIGLQYWAYEEVYPKVEWDGDPVGAQQTENYWLRNRKMFANMQEAIRARDAERALVIVGSGHKYFLDELTREAGYRWVDPREWLPDSSTDTGPGGSANRDNPSVPSS